MSYLAQYVRPRPATVRRPPQGARLDELTLLNRPGFYGDAHVRVFVEDTSGHVPPRRLRRRASTWPPRPCVALQITDCMNEVNLEFALTSPGERGNAVFKVDTLLDALHRFRGALVAEADLYAQRASESK